MEGAVPKRKPLNHLRQEAWCDFHLVLPRGKRHGEGCRMMRGQGDDEEEEERGR